MPQQPPAKNLEGFWRASLKDSRNFGVLLLVTSMELAQQQEGKSREQSSFHHARLSALLQKVLPPVWDGSDHVKEIRTGVSLDCGSP